MSRATEMLARCLAPDEREAVLGDLAESKSSFAASLWDVAGLVIRRGAAACFAPRTAIAFFVLVLPLSFLLTDLAQSTAQSSAVSVWFWTNNLDLHLLLDAGFWHGVAEGAPRLLFACGLLALYGWSASMLASCISRATAILLCVMLLLTAITGVPTLLAAPVLPEAALHANDAVFRLGFYRLVFPRLLECLFVLLPAIYALHNRTLENAR